MLCRACDAPVTPVVDLGEQPIGASFPRPSDPPDERLPLRLGSCAACGLAQLADPSPPEADDPDAPSPMSSATMAAHARSFVDDLMGRGLATPTSRILTIASHGGHLAPFLADAGLQPTVLEASATRADRLREEGLLAHVGILDAKRAPEGLGAGAFDLIVDNYLLAHLDRPRLALARLAGLLAPEGTLVIEFDHLLEKVMGSQWDAIRHGHRSYLALDWLARELARVGLLVGDAVTQPVYGGALRIFARAGASPRDAVARVVGHERAAALRYAEGLAPLGIAVAWARGDVLRNLRAARDRGDLVVGYGAPARAITFLNALGIDGELLPFVVDRSTAKHGRVIPGVRVPIRPVEALTADPPDEVLVLTWNLVDEVRAALAPLVDQGTRLLVAIPRFLDVTDDQGVPAPYPGQGPVR